jgi:hypothetical protein
MKARLRVEWVRDGGSANVVAFMIAAGMALAEGMTPAQRNALRTLALSLLRSEGMT